MNSFKFLSPLRLLLLLLISILCPSPTFGERASLPPLVDEINNNRIVNGMKPIDFTSSTYDLEELGLTPGSPPPKLPVPEIYPPSQHLDYPTPLTVLSQPTPTPSYPYVNQRIHYKICTYNHTKCEVTYPEQDGGPSREWRSVLVGQTIDLRPNNSDDWEPGLKLSSMLVKRPIKVTLTYFASSGWDGDRDSSLNSTIHPSDSTVSTREYYVSDGIQGMAYVVPNYNGKEFTGDLVELDLDTTPYSRVRIHGVESDFADFYSKSPIGADGVDPYVKTSSENAQDQVKVKRLQKLDSDLAGFQGGFGALYNSISYGFLVPYFNGVNHHGKIVRLNCGTFNASKQEGWQAGTTFREFTSSEDFTQDTDFSAIDVVDLTTVDPDLKGFLGGFSKGEYAYFVPFMNGKFYLSKLVRIHVHNFDVSTVQVLDLSLADKRLSGFFGGFSTNIVPGNAFSPPNNYGYLVPYKNVIGRVDGINTKFTADGYKDYNIFNNQESYGGDHLMPNEHGMLVRVNLDTFDAAGIDFLDLTQLDEDLKGFSGGFQGGSHGYLVPYSKGHGDYNSKVVRFSLLDFSLDSVEILDLGPKSDELKGFGGGFSYGSYAVFVPYQNGMTDVNFRARNQFSILTRVDMNNFDISGIKTLDVSRVFRKNTPDFPDENLRGFTGGFAAGSFMYLIPHFNGMWHGKVVRLDMRDFDVLSDLQMSGQSTDLNTGFKGVQEVDLEKYDKGLVGFSGGFVRLRPPPIEAFYKHYHNDFLYGTGMDYTALDRGKQTMAIMPEGGSARENDGLGPGEREGEGGAVLDKESGDGNV